MASLYSGSRTCAGDLADALEDSEGLGSEGDEDSGDSDGDTLDDLDENDSWSSRFGSEAQ